MKEKYSRKIFYIERMYNFSISATNPTQISAFLENHINQMLERIRQRLANDMIQYKYENFKESVKEDFYKVEFENDCIILKLFGIREESEAERISREEKQAQVRARKEAAIKKTEENNEKQKISGHDLGISQNKLKALRRAARDAFGSEDAYEKIIQMMKGENSDNSNS